MENSTKISIVMPVFNSGKYLNIAIDSILLQSFRDFELILVDDGSTDGSSDICDDYAAKDNRIIVVHQQNAGLCNARNAALKIAKGEYIAFCDHDDEYIQGLLKDNYCIAKSHDLDLVKFCKKWDTYIGDKLVSSSTNYFPDSIFNRNEFKDKLIELNKLDFFSCVWDGLFKRSFLIDNNILFDPFFKYGGEDYDFIYRCLINAKHIGFNSKVYYHHYTRSTFSTSSKFDPQKIEVVRKRFEMFKVLIDAYSINMEDYQEEYTRFFIKDFVVPIVMQLNRGSKSLSEKSLFFKDCINSIDFEYDFINSYCLSIIKYKHLSLVQKLYKNKWYRCIFILYSIKNVVLRIIKKR